MSLRFGLYGVPATGRLILHTKYLEKLWVLSKTIVIHEQKTHRAEICTIVDVTMRGINCCQFTEYFFVQHLSTFSDDESVKKY